MEPLRQLPPSLADIDSLARATLARLPEPFAVHLDAVVLIVEDFADDAVIAEMGIASPFDLTGLYSGRPIGEPAASGDPPATIHLYARAILDEWCERGNEPIDHLVTHVLVHEIGHHFGLSDADIDALESSVA